MFLEPDTFNYTSDLRLKSAVATRLAALHDGAAWYRFMKRKELVSWKAYNLRSKVQKIVELDKMDRRIPFTQIADNLKAELIFHRSAHNVNDAEVDSGESLADSEAANSESSSSESDPEAMATPI
jgi:hypothetical protein